MMKKILITLCTLFMVGSGEYAKAMRSSEGKVAEPVVSKAPKDPVNVPKDVQAKSAKTAELAQPKSGSDVVNQNLNIIKSMNGVEIGSTPEYSANPFEQKFTLNDGSEMTTQFHQFGPKKGQPMTSIVMESKSTGRGKNARTTKSKAKEITYNKDGSMIESFLVDNPKYDANYAAQAKSRGVEYKTPEKVISHTVRYNNDGSVSLASFDSNGYVDSSKSGDFTKEEVREGLKNKVSDKKSSMTNVEIATAKDQVTEAVNAKKSLTEIEQAVADANLPDALNAQTSQAQQALVTNVVEGLTEEAPLSESDKSSLIDSGMKMFKAMKKVTAETFNNFVKVLSEFKDYLFKETVVPGPDLASEVNAGNPSAKGSQTGVNLGRENYTFNSAGTSGTGSPRGVDDINSLESRLKTPVESGTEGALKGSAIKPNKSNVLFDPF